MSQYQANIDLASLSGSDGFVIHGVNTLDALGRSGAFIDVNGDGSLDLVIGKIGDNGGGYVLFGGANGIAAPGGTFDLTTINGTNGFAFTAVNYAGISMSGGDVNGDGISDMVVGAASGDGGAFVVFGHTGSFSAALDLTALDGNNGFKITGVQAGSAVGYSVSTADINGDNFADIVIGAQRFDEGANNEAGRIYVVFGKNGGFSPTLDLATLDGTNGFVVTAEPVANGTLGRVVSGGDVNGDGVGDMIVAAPGINNYQGAAYVIFGHSGAFSASIDLATLDGTNGMKLADSTATGSPRGAWSVAVAGDMNGDGIGDLAITSREGKTSGNVKTGVVYVVFGHSGAHPASFDLSTLDGTTGFKIDGGNAYAYDGHSISAAGDVNGDGFGDLLLGAPTQGGNYVGGGYVVFGSASGFSAELDVTTLDGTNGFKLTAPAGQQDSIGMGTAAGDLNHDGLDDIMLSSIGAPNGSQLGTVYVVYGKLPDAAVNRVGTAASQTLVGGDFNDVLDGNGGNDTLWGHGGDDLMIAGAGNVTMYGGDGNDGFSFGATYTAADKVDGGTGTNDQIGLQGDYSAGMTLSAASITNVEVIAMTGTTFTYNFTTANDLVGAGQTMTFWSVNMGTSGHVHLDGGAETDGSFQFFMGQGTDSAIGGAGNDLFYGEGEADVLRGNGGSDTFAYLQATDSSEVLFDTIQDFTAGTDKFLLKNTAVTGIDTKVNGGHLAAATFDPNLQAAIGSGQLAAHHAVLFAPDTGDYVGHTFLIVDADGNAGYQAAVDYVFDVTGGSLGALSTADFI